MRYLDYANEQFRNFAKSRNKPQFKPYTLNLDGKEIHRMTSSEKKYLQNRGEEWLRLKMIQSYRLEEYK